MQQLLTLLKACTYSFRATLLLLYSVQQSMQAAQHADVAACPQEVQLVSQVFVVQSEFSAGSLATLKYSQA